MKKTFLLLVFCMAGASLSAQDIDVFEQLALQKRVERAGLDQNPQPVLPEVYLQWDREVGTSFEASDKMETQAQLEKELKRMRKYYAPFMKDHAPRLPYLRLRRELKTFEWCLLASEMGEDEYGNARPLEKMQPVAEKQWKKVTIPHYEGPMNKAEAVYRKDINISAGDYAADKVFLHFNAADYIVKIFVNNQYVGSHTGLLGAFEFDIKPFVKVGKNHLEIKIFNEPIMMGDNFFLGPNPPRKYGTKLAACGGPGWDEPGLGKGWTMCAPGFGIWQRCFLEMRNDAFIKDIYVRPLLNEAKAVVQVEVEGDMAGKELQYSLFGQNFKATLVRNITVPGPEDAARRYDFEIPIPRNQLRIWSLDTPWLYQLQVFIKEKGKVLDAGRQQFGMRSFEESATSVPKGRFYLNGKEIKLRGANMMGNLMQCVMRGDYDQLVDDILIAKLAGMTYWRMTQQPCQPEVYDYFDRLGLLAQTDMPAFNGYRKDVVDEVKSQFVEMLKLVRNHPSNAIISYLNEPGFGKPMLMQRAEHEQLFLQFDEVAERLHPGQVTKWIEGDYHNISPKHSDHHCYETWYGNSMKYQYLGGWFSTAAGWMCSCGEYGAEGLDSEELMKKYYLKAWMKTDSTGRWNPTQVPRCQTVTVGNKWFTSHITTGTVTDWVTQSREFQKNATRLFTEALRRMPKMNAFSIHLLIDAWPTSWMKAVVDADRQAKPAYFAYRDALRPVAVNLRPDRFYGFAGEKGRVAVFVCNDTPETLSGCMLHYQIEQGDKILYTGKSAAQVPASEPLFQGYVSIPYPETDQRDVITFRAGLFDADGKLIHESSYPLDVFPAAAKGGQLDHPGGYAQDLIK